MNKFPDFMNRELNKVPDELFFPKGTLQGGSCKAGTRTIHCFGGTRIHRGEL